MENNQPTSPTPENSGPTQPEADLVRVEDATDGEIEDYLGKVQAEAPEPEPEGEDVEEPDAKVAPTPEAEPEKPEGPKQEVKETYTREEVEAIQKQAEEQRTRLEQQEAFLKRRSTELGQARQQLAQANEALRKLIQEDSFESPVQAADAVLQMRENEKQIQAIEAESNRMSYLNNWHETVSRHVDPKQVQIDDMIDILKDHKVNPQAIEAFRNNPAETAGPLETIYLAEAAKWKKTARQLVTYIQKLQSETETLRKKPEQVLKQVERNLRQSPTVNGSAGGSSARAAGKESDPSKWSDAEISEFLKQSQN